MQWNHFVQLFDTPDSLQDTVAAYVAQGLDRAELVLVATSAPRWNAIGSLLTSLGRRPAAAIGRGDLVVIDSTTVVRELLVSGAPDAKQFDAIVGTLLHRLAGGGRALRVYGDLVDTLAADGDFAGAQQLEGLWNRLGVSERFTLLCGYSAAHFGNPQSARALRQICRCHSEVLTGPADDLGNWLVDVARSPQLRAANAD